MISFGSQSGSQSEISQLRAEIAQLRAEIQKKIPEDHGARIAELELKISKLWTLAVTYTPVGKVEKLTSYGKKIYGGKFNQ